MTSKSTYEELEQRVQTLEKELADHKTRNGSDRLNHQYLEAILNNTNMPIYLKSADYKYIFMNCQFRRLAHVDYDQVQDKDDFDIFAEPIAQLFRSQDKEVVKRRALVEFEETILLPDGVKTFMTATFPLFDREGKVYAVGGISTDITARKKAEAELKEAEEKYRDILENSSDFIMIISPDFRLAYANRSIQKALGYSEDEINGLSMMDIIHPSETVTCTKKFQRLVSGEDVSFIQTLFVTKEGRTISVEGRCNCKYIEGELVCIRSIFRDITVQKRLQLELQQAQKLESIGILAGGMAHDFNNLLAGIAGVIAVVKSSLPPDDDRCQILTETLDSCMSGKEITSKLITFASGGSPIKRRTKIDKLLRETVEAPLIGFNIQCKFILADDLWLVDVDKSQFRQLVSNVTTNACESMAENGLLTVVTENVLIDDDSFLPKGKYIRIDIRDQGEGIPEENLDKIFFPYFTTKNRPSVKGIGLGLTICSSIIKRHKGKITVDTICNEGTTFHIYLPASATS